MSSFSYRLVVFAIALFAVGASTLSAAQQTAAISGLVSDQTGASVAGAKVELVSGLVVIRSGVTDSEGRYRLEGLQPGQYTVRVTAPGFQPMERRMNVAASGPAAVADFRLAVQTLEESVLVTGERVKAEVEAQRASTPGGVTILDGDELYSRHVNNMADMLRYAPGVFADSGYGNDELFFSSRGSNLDAVDYDKNGVKLLQDGLPVTTADGNNHNRVIDPLTARYASVARGANALTYGASTLGGAIDFTSPTARNSAPLSAFLDGGSFGSLNGRVTVGGARDKVDGLLTVEGRQFDGYRDHSNQERWGLYANAGWQPSTTTNVQLFATYVDNDIRLPGALTRAEVDADPDQASAAALERQLWQGREDRARRGEDDLVLRREWVAVGRSLVRRAVALSPDREPGVRGLRRAGTEPAGGSVQSPDRHRPSRSRRDGALRPPHGHARPARRAQLR